MTLDGIFSLETLILQVGSEVITHKPKASQNTDYEEVEGGGGALNQATPRQQDIQHRNDEGPYETPVILRTKRFAPSIQVDDTEAYDSEIDRELIVRKRKKATTVSNNSSQRSGC